MDKVLSFHQGRLPLLISMPHAGLKLTPAVDEGLVDAARSLPDTDWHIPRLYDFAWELGASVVAAEYSRFVIDLNRPEDDQPLYVGATTGLYPATLFDGEPLFKEGKAPSQPSARAIWNVSGGRTTTPFMKSCCACVISSVMHCYGTPTRSAPRSRTCSRASCRTSTSVRSMAPVAMRDWQSNCKAFAPRRWITAMC